MGFRNRLGKQQFVKNIIVVFPKKFTARKSQIKGHAHEKITSLGEGVAIKIMDSRTICDTRMVEFMKNQATQNNIKFQTEVLTAGGTDTSAIQQMTAGGAISGAISIPTRHIHQVIEMCHKQDIQNAIDLLVTCLTNLDSLKK